MGNLAEQVDNRLPVDAVNRLNRLKVLTLTIVLLASFQSPSYAGDAQQNKLESEQATLEDGKPAPLEEPKAVPVEPKAETKTLNGNVEQRELLDGGQSAGTSTGTEQKIDKVQINLPGIFKMFLGASGLNLNNATIQLGSEIPESEITLSPEECRKMEYGVIGLNAILTLNSANPIVQLVIPGAPAETAGIRAGDLIVKARDHVFKQGEGQRVLWQLVAGRAGTPVEVTVLRNGELLKFTMLRMNIEDFPDKARRRQYESLLSRLGAPHYDADGDLADSEAKDATEVNNRLHLLFH